MILIIKHKTPLKYIYTNEVQAGVLQRAIFGKYANFLCGFIIKQEVIEKFSKMV